MSDQGSSSHLTARHAVVASQRLAQAVGAYSLYRQLAAVPKEFRTPAIDGAQRGIERVLAAVVIGLLGAVIGVLVVSPLHIGLLAMFFGGVVLIPGLLWLGARASDAEAALGDYRTDPPWASRAARRRHSREHPHPPDNGAA
jgi:hypothetical protein